MTLLNPLHEQEAAISKADEVAHDALVELIELIAQRDGRYSFGDKIGYQQSMAEAAESVLHTFQLRYENGGLV